MGNRSSLGAYYNIHVSIRNNGLAMVIISVFGDART